MANKGTISSLYDVFLSFYGDDTRGGFTGHLDYGLRQQGLKTFFRNYDELQSDDQISPSVAKAIEESKTSIVLFSENYASCPSSLDELAKILECKKTRNQQVLPIFYKMDQSDVRYQRNSYSEAMAEHEKRFGKDSEKVQKWRSALYEVTNLPGFFFQDDRYIEEFTKGIVGWVAQSVQHSPVFLTSRGQETNSFTRFLCNALCREGFDTFMDHEILEGGDQNSQYIKAIEEARISVIVFSENYAYSSWCLDELVKIVECKRLKGQRVYPIFYKVKPSDVRFQKKSYFKAMAKHENKFGKKSKKVQKWRSALYKVSMLNGEHLETGYEYKTVQKIVAFINKFVDRYEVFLNFRGEDTRHTFTGYLFDALCQKGIKTFMDDEALEVGIEMSVSLPKAIEESRISIIVFSKNYAYSQWCLDELVKIIECMKMKGHLVLPIFYKVEQSDVRHQRNSYGKAMAAHERRLGKDSKKVQEWRSALFEATNLRGWHFKTGHEYEFIEMIVEIVNGCRDQYLNSPASTKSLFKRRLEGRFEFLLLESDPLQHSASTSRPSKMTGILQDKQNGELGIQSKRARK